MDCKEFDQKVLVGLATALRLTGEAAKHVERCPHCLLTWKIHVVLAHAQTIAPEGAQFPERIGEMRRRTGARASRFYPHPDDVPVWGRLFTYIQNGDKEDFNDECCNIERSSS